MKLWLGRRPPTPSAGRRELQPRRELHGSLAALGGERSLKVEEWPGDDAELASTEEDTGGGAGPGEAIAD